MKPIFWLRRCERASSESVGHFHVVELVAAGLVGLEQSRDVEERGLARARGPGDREELAGLHLQREIAQRMRLDEVGAKNFADIRSWKAWPLIRS